jgi:hypothetical protein
VDEGCGCVLTAGVLLTPGAEVEEMVAASRLVPHRHGRQQRVGVVQSVRSHTALTTCGSEVAHGVQTCADQRTCWDVHIEEEARETVARSKGEGGRAAHPRAETAAATMHSLLKAAQRNSGRSQAEDN